MSATLEELRLELQGRRRDYGNQKHTPNRYNAAINRALTEAPSVLWVRAKDDSLDTIDETRRYSLAGITDIVLAFQVTAAWIDDVDGHPERIANWEVEDNAGSLTLVLDDNPRYEDRTITIEYITPFDELDDDSDETEIDKEWLLCMALTSLLLEADPELEDPQMIARDLQLADAKREAREAALRRRNRRTGKIRTLAWR